MGKKLTIEIHLDNSAFHDQEGNLDFHTIQDQVVLVAEDIGDGNDSQKIVDCNGNSVGQFFIEQY